MIWRRSFLRFLCVALLSSALSLPGPPLRAFEALPPEIADEAFWKLIEDFSEDGGAFPSENFVSNESGYQAVIPQLQSIPGRGGVYLGVGPEQNFTYVAGLEPRLAFIIDIRRQNMIQHLMYKALFEMSIDRADFLSMLFSRRRPAGVSEASSAQELFDAFSQVIPDTEFATQNLAAIRKFLVEDNNFSLSAEDEATLGKVFDAFVRYGPNLSYGSAAAGVPGRGRAMPTYAELMVLDDQQGTNRSYLASEENFARVRQMQQRNLIVPLVGNFAGPKTLRAVGNYLRDHGAAVSIFYVSNVEQYLFMELSAGRFYENMATLPLNPASTLIRTTNGLTSPTSLVGARDFNSVLASMTDLLQAFMDGSIQGYLDVLRIQEP